MEGSTATPSAAPAPAPAPAPNAPGSAPSSSPAPAGGEVPEWVPAQFRDAWGSDGYQEKVSRAYSETYAKLSTRTDDMRAQLTTGIEAARRAGLPEKPEGYVFRAEPGSSAHKLLEKNGVMIVGDDWDPNTAQKGIAYFKQSAASDMLGWWQAFCHEHAIPLDRFSEGVSQMFAREKRKLEEAAKTQSEQWAADDAIEAKKLGPNGAERRLAAEKALKALTDELVGPEKGPRAFATMNVSFMSAEGVEAFEALLARLNGGGAPSQPGSAPPSNGYDAAFAKTLSQLKVGSTA